MKLKYMNKFISLVLFAILMFSACKQHESIRTSTRHPGYWQYNGQTVLLIGGWNHGHNPFLDHNTMDSTDTSTEKQIIDALDELVDAGGNLLRCVLDPGAGAGRLGFDFCSRSGDLSDLSVMTGPYWEHLDLFLRETEKRGIIVGIEIWDRFDWYDSWGKKGFKNWQNSPFNPKNNINYTTETSGLEETYELRGGKPRNPFGWTTPGQSAYDTADAVKKAQYDLVRKYQEGFMNKLLSVTFKYGNVLYSANNEVRFQEPAWGEYWIKYIRKEAKAQDKSVICTDMFWDLIDLPGPCDFDYLMDHKDFYDYFDISQSSLHRKQPFDTERKIGEMNWIKVTYAVDKARSVGRLTHMNKIYGSDLIDDAWQGEDNNAIEDFWRSLFAGVAGARFHRPPYGLGLSDKAKNSMKAVRFIEEWIKFWEIDPHQELLTSRELDEAYLAARPGEKYLVFFTDGGSVGLNLESYSGSKYELKWFDIDIGEEFSTQEQITGGAIATLNAPGDGHWLGILNKI